MPKIGDKIRADKIGFKSLNWLIWASCLHCGSERWVRLKRGGPEYKSCRKCANKGQRNGDWKGGKSVASGGYVRIVISPDDWVYPMVAKSGYCLEHRVVMARHLGRYLLKSEQVHHRNGIRTDNRIENLELISIANHALQAKLCGSCSLRKEIRLLRWQIKQLQECVQKKMPLNLE